MGTKVKPRKLEPGDKNMVGARVTEARKKNALSTMPARLSETFDWA